MTTQRGAVEPEVANMEGVEALPRKNGELVFEELWEGRVFGMAVALNDQGMYPWREFRDTLVQRIAEADAADDGSTYYERFLAAFERLALEKGLVTPEELEVRTEEYASGARSDFEEDDHDHDHDHHDHAH
jgi:nitrile hydratase accessory protein